MKIKWKFSHWLPRLLRVNGITLYPFVLFASDECNVKDRWLVHEYIHIKQQRKDGLIKFYFLYVWEYLCGFMTSSSHDAAYRNIPYEREAYGREHSEDLMDELLDDYPEIFLKD